MRILHVVPSYFPAVRYGGPIYSVHGLARAQAKRGDDVHVFTTNVDGPGVSPTPLGQPVDLDGVKVWYFPCGFGRRLFRSPQMGRALARYAGEFDVLHAHSVFLWPTLRSAQAARAAGTPYVLAPRGMLVDELIRRKSSLAKRIWITMFERFNVANAAAIHVTSSIEAREIERLRFSVRRFCVVANGVDLPARSAPRETRARPYALFLGRVNWKKGLDRLIPAMAHTKDVDLVIAGNDEEGYRATLDSLARECGVADRISFVGHVGGEKKRELLQGAAVFVLPSYSENFGIAVLEAMAHGAPVIVTPEVGLAADVERTGAGLVVSGEPSALGAAIADLAVDGERRRALGDAGRRAAEESFSWVSIAAKMHACYADIVKTRYASTSRTGSAQYRQDYEN